MKIIGLTGFAKSGKSTAAQILKDLGGYEVAFAKHLKDVCSVVLGVDRSWFDDQNFKEKDFGYPIYLNAHHIEQILAYFEISSRFVPGAIVQHVGTEFKTARYIAQYVGTEVLRSIDPNIHISMAFKLAPPEAKFLICSDMRFANELLAVKERDGLTIGISRAAIVPADLVNLHPSEKEIPSLIKRADVVFHNETTIAEFQASVKSVVVDFLRN